MALTREDLIMQLFTQFQPAASDAPAAGKAEILELINEIAVAVDGQRGGGLSKAPLKYVEEFMAAVRARRPA